MSNSYTNKQKNVEQSNGTKDVDDSFNQFEHSSLPFQYKRTGSAPPSISEQQRYQTLNIPNKSHNPYYANHYQPYGYGYPFPPPYGYPPNYIQQVIHTPKQPMSTAPVKKSQRRLAVKDPNTNKEINLEELVKDDGKSNYVQETKRKSIPGVPQEILNLKEVDEEEKKKREEEEKKKQEEEERKRLEEEEEERKRLEEEERKRLEEEERKRLEEEERKRLEQERLKKEEEERICLEQEEHQRQEEKRRREDEEKIRRREASKKSHETEDEEDWEKATEQIDVSVDEPPRVTNKITYDRETLLKYQLLVKPSPGFEDLAKKFSIHTSNTTPQVERTPSSGFREKPYIKKSEGRTPQSYQKTSPFSRHQRPYKPKTPIVQLPPTKENSWVRPGSKDISMDIRRILNKISPQNYETLIAKLFAIEGLHTIDNCLILSQLIFEKAQKDTKYSELYSQLCFDLNHMFLKLENEELHSFRKIIVNLCALKFQKRERPEPIPDSITDPMEREDKEIEANKLRENLYGMMKFIGELYNKGMVSGRHMIACLKELILERHIVDLELFSSLLQTLGEKLDKEVKYKQEMNDLFKEIISIARSDSLETRVKVIFQNLVDLKRNKWKPRGDS